MDDNTTLQQRPRFSRRGFIGGAAALVMTGGNCDSDLVRSIVVG